ncbi:MAG TPA: bifunctional 4-hydroxy-2-oxoglutarate aldolase/2-dehydro-3-deoxy-phosphogluconate aldolase [Acidobacteriaceae bacterium]
MTKQEVMKWVFDLGLVPVLRAPSPKEAKQLVAAMVAGGVTVMEVTTTVPGAMELISDLKKEYGDTILLGSGTITTADQCKASIDAGAEFVVSPSTHLEVIETTKKMGKVSMPGALTPTEVITAWNAGADIVKVFPCSAVGGASYLKALKAPFPFLKLIPTGGVTLATTADFLKAGAEALGVGSDLVSVKAIKEGKPELVTAAAKAYLEAIKKARAVA